MNWRLKQQTWKYELAKYLKFWRTFEFPLFQFSLKLAGLWARTYNCFVEHWSSSNYSITNDGTKIQFWVELEPQKVSELWKKYDDVNTTPHWFLQVKRKRFWKYCNGINIIQNNNNKASFSDSKRSKKNSPPFL